MMQEMNQLGIYVASRTWHAGMWRETRAKGIHIISSWIDEAGEGETEDLGELWTRVQREVRSAARLVFFVQIDDFPLKGALVEVGMALAVGVPVYAVLDPDIKLEPRSMRPVGSWLHHPSVRIVPTLFDAFTNDPARQFVNT